MPLVRKRQVADIDPANSHETNIPRRPRPSEASPSGDTTGDEGMRGGAHTSEDVMVKKLVRLALASEYSRLQIRRNDISQKVLGENGSRKFKVVFDEAQRQLRTKFGMEMSELPAKEQVTVQQRRAAKKKEKPSSSNTKSWIVTTVLPQKYRTPDIIVPTKAPSDSVEGARTALYSFIIALISLNGGTLNEQKLERYLRRTNMVAWTPWSEKLPDYLQRLVRLNYLVRIKEQDNGEEIIDYMVGPRGKLEVGSTGVAGFVREVYGFGSTAQTNDEDGPTQIEQELRANFEQQLRRSLGLSAPREDAEGEDHAGTPAAAGHGTGANNRGRRESRRATTAASGEEEDEEEDESD
ncbi:MAGE family-domain-containing protein [Penicillium chermesinum]|uniref:MAGE family-domain-containing protein n=1 Tax=Penicillium chermesinum TaxID=63820 RepID=A0A9W9N870_9EURO|nr:MAGE family-domain-containing protein [Penicillium chermesinum]KAJ5215053.1 MAGE family-domain-containing protein [Penicillium chermesinum]KAJ6141453.1 MAGE family-domain-containing protein [Penicillium chermesinum]